jgi:hypothetical protein
MKKILFQNSWMFLAKFLPASLQGVSAGYCQRAPVDKSEMIRHSSFTYHPFIQCYTVWDIEKSSLNKVDTTMTVLNKVMTF